MVLHTLSAAPSSGAYKDCVNVIQSGDALVLMGDGVYAAIEGTQTCAELQDKDVELYVLNQDAQLAGITQIPATVRSIDMTELVILTERFSRQLAWYE